MVNVRAEIKKQIEGALAGAKFPIKTPEALFKAFPQGADTTCQAGNVKVTAGEAGKLLTADDFPVKSAEEIAEKIVSRAKLPTK